MLKYLFCAVLCFVLVDSASASLLVGDGFDYTTPGNLAGNADSDFPSNPATWFNTGAGAGPSIISGNVTYSGSGTPPHLTGANSASLVNNVAAAHIQLASPATGGVFSDSATPNTTLYYSFQLNVANTTGLLTGAGGGIIAGFNNSVGSASSELTSVAGDLLIRKDNSGDTTYHLGIAQQSAATANRYFDNSTAYSQGSSLFVVAAYNFGSNAGDDTADLYVFAGSTAVPITKPVSPTVHAAYGAEINGSVDSISSFFLRDNGGGTGTVINVDDLRVGTSWADAVAAPEPTTLGLLAVASIGALARRRRKA